MLWSAPREQRDAYLKSAWAAGVSSARIAQDMHTTRNAVIGRLGRMGLFGKGTSTHKRVLTPRCQQEKKPLPRKRLPPEVIATVIDPIKPPPPRVLPNSAGEAILWLRPKQCRYPNGEIHKPGFYFCAGDQLQGSSYCAFHSKLCLNGNPERSKWQTPLLAWKSPTRA